MRGLVTFKALGSYGRLANQMFQIAGTIGVARRNGMDFVFPEWINLDHKERFGSSEDIGLEKYFVNPLPRIPDGLRWNDRPVEWGYQDVRLGPGNWNLSGHFQSFKYFAHCFEEVKYYMRMKDEYKQNDYCAIHVRLGDYDDRYHPRLGLNYYSEAIKRFPKDTEFVVFSDDRKEALKMLRPLGLNIAASVGQNYIQDFALMKSFRHFIIGNSSFSAMAAILGEAKDKRVIAPSPWFGPQYTNITGKDIYCEGWEVVDYEKQKAIR